MRKSFSVLVGLVAAMAALPAGSAFANGAAPASARSTIAVYGDSPYGSCNVSDPAAVTCTNPQLGATGAFIDTINNDPDVGLVLHIGDIHSGKDICTEAYDQQIRTLWNGFVDPVVYTPGDNEWTDCHKPGEGGQDPATNPANVIDYASGNPIDNLALIRRLFFPRPGVTLGTNKRIVLSQQYVHDPRYPTDASYVENVMWTQSGVLFVTINVPGGSNNDQDVWYGKATPTQAQLDETSQRTGADLRWLDYAFGLAKVGHMKGIVIGAQADMWDPEKYTAGPPVVTHQEGFEPIVASLASHTAAFGKPVVMFNGDSHVYRSDDPLSPGAGCAWEKATACTSVAFVHPGYDVPNFHRVVVHGSTNPMEWLKVTIDPSANAPQSATAFGPFSWARQTQALP